MIEWPPKIEKGIEIPSRRKRPKHYRIRRHSAWYLFLEGLVVGDSFVYYKWAKATIYRNAKKLGIHLEGRNLKREDGRPCNLMRVWRTE